jgi:hypothetical protein
MPVQTDDGPKTHERWGIQPQPLEGGTKRSLRIGVILFGAHPSHIYDEARREAVSRFACVHLRLAANKLNHARRPIGIESCMIRSCDWRLVWGCNRQLAEANEGDEVFMVQMASFKHRAELQPILTDDGSVVKLKSPFR